MIIYQLYILIIHISPLITFLTLVIVTANTTVTLLKYKFRFASIASSGQVVRCCSKNQTMTHRTIFSFAEWSNLTEKYTVEHLKHRSKSQVSQRNLLLPLPIDCLHRLHKKDGCWVGFTTKSCIFGHFCSYFFMLDRPSPTFELFDNSFDEFLVNLDYLSSD